MKCRVDQLEFTMSVTRKSFRAAFEMATKDVAHYFPMHMSKGMTNMQRRLKDVDFILEVHDARFPISGRNSIFSETLFLRPHMLLLNKMDTADLSYKNQVETILKQKGVNHIMYTDCKKDRHTSVRHKLMPKIMEILENSPRYHRAGADHFNMLVVGVPNVGKSSLINALRRNNLKKGKATRVGGVPGITTSVLEKIRVANNPKVYLLDTPGIMLPDIHDMDVGMKLALCATIRDHLLGEDLIVDYLLFWLNKHGLHNYIQMYNLPGPTDNVYEMLGHICKENQFSMKKRNPAGGYMFMPNFIRAAQLVLRNFREGHLGKYNLDLDLIKSLNEPNEHKT